MKKLYKNDETILLTPEYFLKEIHGFRKIMCSREYTFEQKDNAFKGLLYVYICTENLDIDGSIVFFFKMTVEEWEKRSVLELFSPFRKLED